MRERESTRMVGQLQLILELKHDLDPKVELHCHQIFAGEEISVVNRNCTTIFQDSFIEHRQKEKKYIENVNRKRRRKRNPNIKDN